MKFHPARTQPVRAAQSRISGGFSAMFAGGPIEFGNASPPAADLFVEKVVVLMDFHGCLGIPALISRGFRCFQLGSHHLPFLQPFAGPGQGRQRCPGSCLSRAEGWGPANVTDLLMGCSRMGMPDTQISWRRWWFIWENFGGAPFSGNSTN